MSVDIYENIELVLMQVVSKCLSVARQHLWTSKLTLKFLKRQEHSSSHPLLAFKQVLIESSQDLGIYSEDIDRAN